MGISYGGISQLFVAKTDPPDLAAITPLSVIDNSATTLYPGGILNTGFALPWTKERDQDALANSPTSDQAWALKQIHDGDATCKANQALHQEAVNLVKQVRANSHYVPSVADPLSPITFVHKIKVPTYMACQFTDEQTGGHCTDLAEHFTGTRHKWFTFTNGVHTDSLDPATFNALVRLPRAVRRAAQSDRVGCGAGARADVVCDRARRQRRDVARTTRSSTSRATPRPWPRSRDCRRSGCCSTTARAARTPGSPVPGFEHSFSRFPVPGTQARSWYLGPSGTLAGGPPAKRGQASFKWRKAVPATDFSG